MTEPLIMEPPAAPDSNPNLCAESYSLPIPPLDPIFFSEPDPTSMDTIDFDLDFILDENGDFDFSFDGLDDFYFPSDTKPIVIPSADQGQPGNLTPDAGISGISGHRESGDAETYLNCYSSESGSCNRKLQEGSCDRFSGSDLTPNFPSPASSQGSGNCCSGGSEATNVPSPDSSNLGFGQKVEAGETAKDSVAKRKKENEETNGEYRSCKYPKSSQKASATSEEEEKWKARLVRNRESAQLSRQRKKQYVEELEGKMSTMRSTIAELNCKMSYIMAENAALRQQLSCGGGGGAIYPPLVATPVPYSWVPSYPPYAVNPHGSQVPLVAIPKLKTQRPMLLGKVKKSETKSKTKKVASVSFIGLLFFIFLFGGLVPFVNFNYGGTSETFNGEFNFVRNLFYDQHRGRVLMVDGHSNVSDSSKGVRFSDSNFHSSDRKHHERTGYEGSAYHAHLKEPQVASAMGNANEPLFASLYVPRNDKLVKIDGNLIVHSVLASEKAKALKKPTSESNNGKETGLTIPEELSSALAIPDTKPNGGILPHLYRTSNEHPKAISSGSADGKTLHQWFHEGGRGPMLNSGVCTEVFQFDVSAPGAIIPSSSVSDASTNHHHNATHLKKRKNRRVLQGLPGSVFNITRDHMGKNSEKDNFRGGNKTSSSMVVSVLVDPREFNDADIDGMMAPKSLSRISVVVFLDSVKYVTYSCTLPLSGLHLVAT